VLRAAAENLTYATTELGGKNALIVLGDADMDTAVAVAVEACSATRAKRARRRPGCWCTAPGTRSSWCASAPPPVTRILHTETRKVFLA
jgi:Aldehyde dehydrogenase family